MSRVGKIVRIFFKRQNKVDKIVAFYIHHRNLYNKGEGEVGFIRRLIGFQPLMITWLFLRDLFPGLPTEIIVVAIPTVIVFKLVINWLVGYLWDRKRFFDNENTWQNERNPAIKFIQEKLANGG